MVRGRGGVERRWRGTFIAVAILCIPAAGQLLRFRGGTISWIPQPTFRQLGDTLILLAGGNWPLFVLTLAAAAYMGWAARRTGRSGAATAFDLIWLVLPVSLVYVLSYVTPLFLPRYLIVVVPAISLAAGAGIAVLASAARFCALAVAGFLALVGLSGLQLARWYTLPQKEDWRSATHYILGHQRPGDRIVFEVGGAERPFFYYEHRDRRAGPPRDHSEYRDTHPQLRAPHLVPSSPPAPRRSQDHATRASSRPKRLQASWLSRDPVTSRTVRGLPVCAPSVTDR